MPAGASALAGPSPVRRSLGEGGPARRSLGVGGSLSARLPAGVAAEKVAMQQKAGPGEQVFAGKNVKGVESNRKPDVQRVDQSGKTVEIVEVQRKPGDTYDRRRKEEYDRLGIPNETKPIPKP